jgi:hypothetical protein
MAIFVIVDGRLFVIIEAGIPYLRGEGFHSV